MPVHLWESLRRKTYQSPTVLPLEGSKPTWPVSAIIGPFYTMLIYYISFIIIGTFSDHTVLTIETSLLHRPWHQAMSNRGLGDRIPLLKPVGHCAAVSSRKSGIYKKKVFLYPLFPRFCAHKRHVKNFSTHIGEIDLSILTPCRKACSPIMWKSIVAMILIFVPQFSLGFRLAGKGTNYWNRFSGSREMATPSFRSILK